MTTNQPIDGVPRDSVLQLVEFLADARAFHKVVIERCNDCVKSGESSEREEYGRIGYRTEKIEQVDRLAGELRALLDAPFTSQYDGMTREQAQSVSDGIDAIIGIPAAQPQGEPVACMPIERCYDVRAKMIIAFNEARKNGGDLDDGLDAAYKSALRFSPNPLSVGQPASLAVVMPETKAISAIVTKAARKADLIPGANYYTAAEISAEDVIAEVTRLNTPQ